MADDKINIQFIIDSAKSAKDLNSLNKSLEQLNGALEDVTKGSEEYNAIQKSLAETTERANKQSYESALANAENAKSVGDMKKALKELKSQIAQVGEGTKEFKQLSAAAGDLADKIGDTADATKAFTGTGVEKLTASFGFLKDSFTNFDPGKFKTALSGIAGAMKAIPLILIIEGIKYLVENFEKLSKGSGFLGKALRAIGAVIDWVKDKIFAFTDAIGLTNSALDKQGEEIKKNAEKNKEALDSVSAAYDRQISEAKAAGKSTVKLEKAKQEAIIQTNLAVAKQIEAFVRAGGELDEEKRKLLSASLEAIKGAKSQEKIIDLEEVKTKKDLAKKSLDDKKKKLEEELKALKNKTKIEVLNTKEGTQERINAEKIANEQIAKFYEKNADDLGLSNDEKLILIKEANDSIFKEQQALDDKIEKELEDARKKAEDEEKKKADELKKLKISSLTESQKLVDLDLKATIDKEGVTNLTKLQIQQDFLDKQKQAELNLAEETGASKKEIEEKYSNLSVELAQKVEDEKTKIAEKAAQDSASSIQALSDTVFDIKMSGLQKGSQAEQDAAKKQFKINKSLQLAGAIMNGFKAITASLAEAPVAIGPIPNPAGIASLAFAATTSAANIAKIASTQFQSTSSAPSAPSGAAKGAVSGGGSAFGNQQGGSIINPQLQRVGGNMPQISNTKSNEIGPGAPKEPIKAYVVTGDISTAQDKASIIKRRTQF